MIKVIHKETESKNKKINNLLKDKEQIMNRLSRLYNDRCDGIITGELYKELSKESEFKLRKINECIKSEELNRQNVKNRVTVLPDYTKKIKELLDLNKPKQSLIDTLIDTIIIDEYRNISIKFKYDVISQINFKYENRNLPRNPYGRKGKNKIIISK